MKVKLVKTEQITPTVKTFWFEPEKQLDYVAGQFIELTLPHANPDNRGERRWFTLSSSPTEPLLAITTKLATKPSSFMRNLFDLSTGASVTMSEAMGDFVLPRDKSVPLIFVIGGIGITPVRSMFTWLQDNNEQRNIYVLYASGNNNEFAFNQLIEATAKKVDYFHGPKRLDTDHILQVVSAHPKPLTYLSGPEELVELLVAELREAGISGAGLVTDYFPGYEQI